ncbi:helix-turn-helix domain-containing protein [Duganella sp. FT92W]|uniref:Helix-turn-helix domain-containing protein n=1 Tax=Pseudoduganella rivuli TaxID=2666085 RepID=A0A7X2IT15_9BURK|nr:AraC family transcriptional regulator [Pseudoduganella rivuli]MRV75519.1 helix-turn-helix domain-containing protein [Pseudoduganella rivuli]
MLTEAHISTDNLRADKRLALVRDTAFNLFNLEVKLGGTEAADVAADIRVARGPVAGVVDVHTSWSVVERTRARASAAGGDNFLVYLIKQGGSWFQNGSGEEFVTSAGAVVVGSQDAAYKAAAAPGRDWRFNVLSVPGHLLSFAGERIRQGGFQMVPPQAPLSQLLTSYVASLCVELPRLDVEATAAALRALDQLLASSMNGKRPPAEQLAHALSDERRRAALHYIQANLESAALSPAGIAHSVGISPRQLHRLFEEVGHSVGVEIRRLRVERAQHLIHGSPERTITDIAFACGFDSLATFYRAFKAEAGMTASEFRTVSPR